jgi:hypothetical protein
MGDEMEGGGRGLIELLSHHFVGGLEENHENLKSVVPFRDSNRMRV